MYVLGRCSTIERQLPACQTPPRKQTREATTLKTSTSTEKERQIYNFSPPLPIFSCSNEPGCSDEITHRHNEDGSSSTHYAQETPHINNNLASSFVPFGVCARGRQLPPVFVLYTPGSTEDPVLVTFGRNVRPANYVQLESISASIKMIRPLHGDGKIVRVIGRGPISFMKLHNRRRLFVVFGSFFRFESS